VAGNGTLKTTTRIVGLVLAVLGIALVLSFIAVPWLDLGSGGILFRHPLVFSLAGLGTALVGSVLRGWGCGRKRRCLVGLGAGWLLLMAEELGLVYGIQALPGVVPQRLSDLVLWVVIVAAIVTFGVALALIIACWAQPRKRWRNEDQTGSTGSA
jgi:hypothetical protein